MKETICLGCMEKYEGSNICPYCWYDQNSKVKKDFFLEPGAILKGKYLIGQVLGFGGFGITYMARDLALETKITIKEFFPGNYATRALGETQVTICAGEGKTQYEAQLGRFIGMARNIARFSAKEGIVSVYDYFMENNTGYIVREYLSCRSLSELLKEKGCLPYQDAVSIILQILEGLRVMHMSGILYREVTPSNIIVTEDLKAKLVDTGGLIVLTDDQGSMFLNNVLSSGYSPIEEYRTNVEKTPAIDVYASAATLYRMITGKKPPESFDRIRVFQSEKKDILRKPSEFGIKIPKGLENAIINGLHIMKEDRYQTVDEFMMAIKKRDEQETPQSFLINGDKKQQKHRWFWKSR